MSKQKNTNNGSQPAEELKIKKQNSSLAEFVARDVADDKELAAFEKMADEEVKKEEMENSLLEIYRDESGKMVNVSRLEVKKKRGFGFWLLIAALAGAIFGSLAYYGYSWYLKYVLSSEQVAIELTGKNEVVAGEEFTYHINYKNLTNLGLKDIEVRFSYPENFLISAVEPAVGEGEKDVWKKDYLGSHRSDEISIKGRFVGGEGSKGTFIAKIIYSPENISSRFEKDSVFETNISHTGIKIGTESSGSALVGEENEIVFKYQAEEINYLDNFRLTIAGSDNLEVIDKKFLSDFSTGSSSASSTDSGVAVVAGGIKKDVRPNSWLVENPDKTERNLSLYIRFKNKISPTEEVVLFLEYSPNGSDYYKFFEKKLTYDLVKNNLNLNLILNGSRDGGGIDFGQTLNYSLVYSNKGEAEMKDVVIMAVLDGDLLDWNTLSDGNKGILRNHTITWSKEQLPALADIKTDDEGAIDFSIKVLSPEKVTINPSDTNLTSKYQLKSYAQFSVGSSTMPIKEKEDTKSNVIISKINSDFKLNEEVRYFDADNLAVGFGPLPPKVGETTSFKVYWRLTNNLHELRNAKVEAVLPSYVEWGGKNQVTLGNNIEYNSAERKVVWNIGRMPLGFYEAQAEFNINVKPNEDDAGKIMVLLNGSTAMATDNETNIDLIKTTKPKTTKLEDDEIGASDGRIVK